MTGHVLIHWDALTPETKTWLGAWAIDGKAWESPRRGFYVLKSDWPSHTIERLVREGWPKDALEIGGR
jgi:hypothetical protein